MFILEINFLSKATNNNYHEYYSNMVTYIIHNRLIYHKLTVNSIKPYGNREMINSYMKIESLNNQIV